jgi:hypothetical protein
MTAILFHMLIYLNSFIIKLHLVNQIILNSKMLLLKASKHKHLNKNHNFIINIIMIKKTF